MATPVTSPDEMEVFIPTTNDRKHEHGLQMNDLEECWEDDLYEKMTSKQKVILGVLCAVVALEALYVFVLVVKYIANWFIMLLAVTRQLKRLRSQP